MATQPRREYGERVQFVFRFFPLANHAYGMDSAQAAYAASLQGKFWEMRDLLFARQGEWAESADPRPHFDDYAKDLGLDMGRFHADLDSASTVAFITGQAAAVVAAGVNHTPWFVVGDSSVLPRGIGGFRSLIEADL